MYSFLTLVYFVAFVFANSNAQTPRSTTTTTTTTTASTTTTIKVTERFSDELTPILEEGDNFDTSFRWDLERFPDLVNALLPEWHKSIRQFAESKPPTVRLFKELGDIYYYVTKLAVSHAETIEFCKLAESHLYEITNSQDAEQLFLMIDSNNETLRDKDLWLSKGDELPIRWRPKQAAVDLRESGSTLNCLYSAEMKLKISVLSES